MNDDCKYGWGGISKALEEEEEECPAASPRISADQEEEEDDVWAKEAELSMWYRSWAYPWLVPSCGVLMCTKAYGGIVEDPRSMVKREASYGWSSTRWWWWYGESCCCSESLLSAIPSVSVVPEATDSAP